MSIADSTDLPPQRNTLYTAAELFSEPQRLCKDCASWAATDRATAYSAPCTLGVVYGLTLWSYAGCAWHSANASAPPLPGDGDEC